MARTNRVARRDRRSCRRCPRGPRRTAGTDRPSECGTPGRALGSSADETPLRSLRLALQKVLSAEDASLLRRWIAVAATPGMVKTVLGGIQLKRQAVIAEFLGSRLDLPSDALVPTMLAAAVGGVIQAAHAQWFTRGGNLATTASEGLEVLERGIGSDPRSWIVRTETTAGARREQAAKRRRPA